jgi:hypothetical protein
VNSGFVALPDEKPEIVVFGRREEQMREFKLVPSLVCGSVATPQSFTITDRIYDQTGVPGELLKQAESQAAFVARQAGFTIEWLGCATQRDACSRELQPSEVVLLLRAKSRLGKYAEAGRAFLGSPHTSVYTMIFYQDVRRIAAPAQVSVGTLLGYVIVHELGHLMGLNHGRMGVMIGKWKPRGVALMKHGALRFSTAERKQMQSEMVARNGQTEWP